MTRRSLLRGFVACIAASAIEVCGWAPPKVPTAKELYDSAAYESVFIMHPDVCKLLGVPHPQYFKCLDRFDRVGEEWVHRPEPPNM